MPPTRILEPMQPCLAARRLVERGVRFVELTINPGNGDRWDQHRPVDGHQKRHGCGSAHRRLDQRLKSRGLLDTITRV